MRSFRIGTRTLSDDSPPFIIADACNNHLGNFQIAQMMIERAAAAGADCIKFQHHLADDCMLPSTGKMVNGMPLYDFLKENEFTIEVHGELKDICKKNGIEYLCTPFGYEAADELDSIGVDAFKIGSGEVTDFGFISHVASFGKPMIVSTGMCDESTVMEVYSILNEIGVDFSLLHCVSEYPPSYGHIRLGVIKRMLEVYPDIIVGFSDHAKSNYAAFASVALGARIIEKHFILGDMPGPDLEVSLDFDGLCDLVLGCHLVESAMSGGDRREITDEEAEIATWANRSVVALGNIRKGAEITRGMLTTKRPSGGIPARYIGTVVGRTAIKDIVNNSQIQWSDLDS
jgi:sialic acid synthase SpsE